MFVLVVFVGACVFMNMSVLARLYYPVASCRLGFLHVYFFGFTYISLC